eukprot:2349633-Rhodomonas_salina.9
MGMRIVPELRLGYYCRRCNSVLASAIEYAYAATDISMHRRTGALSIVAKPYLQAGAHLRHIFGAHTTAALTPALRYPVPGSVSFLGLSSGFPVLGSWLNGSTIDLVRSWRHHSRRQSSGWRGCASRRGVHDPACRCRHLDPVHRQVLHAICEGSLVRYFEKVILIPVVVPLSGVVRVFAPTTVPPSETDFPLMTSEPLEPAGTSEPFFPLVTSPFPIVTSAPAEPLFTSEPFFPFFTSFPELSPTPVQTFGGTVPFTSPAGPTATVSFGGFSTPPALPDCSSSAPDLIVGNDDCCQGFCAVMEGDCDFDFDCIDSLLCGTDNCPWGDEDDCCYEPVDCSSFNPDTTLGNDDCCQGHCGVMEGDCDSDGDCFGDLICGTDNCPWGDGDDCCYSRCSIDHPNKTLGNDDCCQGLCLVGEGDCDFDFDCIGDLVCGTDNCAWGDGDDCCEFPPMSILSSFPLVGETSSPFIPVNTSPLPTNPLFTSPNLLQTSVSAAEPLFTSLSPPFSTIPMETFADITSAVVRSSPPPEPEPFETPIPCPE